MKTLIIGNGWYGNIIKDYLKADMSVKRISDLSDEDLSTYDAVINTAAKTNVDWIEKNKLVTLYDNTISAVLLAKMCARQGKKYVFISSGCIFKSETEDDIKYEDSIPNPLSFSSRSKAMAEELIQEANPDAIILRIRLPISEKPHPKNTLSKISNYPKLSTQVESITVVEDTLPIIEDLLERGEKGIFHLVNEGYISPADMGEALGYKFVRISKKELSIMLKESKKVDRVTTFMGSKRIPMMPEIKERINGIAKQWVLTK